MRLALNRQERHVNAAYCRVCEREGRWKYTFLVITSSMVQKSARTNNAEFQMRCAIFFETPNKGIRSRHPHEEIRKNHDYQESFFSHPIHDAKR